MNIPSTFFPSIIAAHLRPVCSVGTALSILNKPPALPTRKQVIYDGFKTAIASGVPQQKAAILVDEQFGAAILRDASARGFHTACPAEKSGQEEFDFEYGEDFAAHIEVFAPHSARCWCAITLRPIQK